MSRKNFKKPQIGLFKEEISPVGNFACQQTCSHSKTLTKKWRLTNVRDHIPLKYVAVQVNLIEHSVTINSCLRSRFESCNGISDPNLFVFIFTCKVKPLIDV